MPDHHNPTGLVMPDRERAAYARLLASTARRRSSTRPTTRCGSTARPAQRPFASFAKDAITVGSASKSVWGGLRLGWIRAPHSLVDQLVRARVGMDLGAPVLEQLVLIRLVTGEFDAVLAAHRARLR